MAANQQQSQHWNSDEAKHWTDHADRYDRQLAPFGNALMETLTLGSGERLLDVGCGNGVTTLAATRIVSAAVGIDISAPMLNVARQRAIDTASENASFLLADAQTHEFVPESFDVVMSRFGVMFFDDPTAAFANLNLALRPGGRIGFVCWQPLGMNPWLLVPGLAAAAHVDLPDMGSDGPGMFSLAAQDSTAALLDRAGFNDIVVESFEPIIMLGGGGTLDEALDYLLGTGIARALFANANDESRALATAAVTEAFIPYFVEGEGVCIGSGAWIVTARK